jgi:hypothetical protein
MTTIGLNDSITENLPEVPRIEGLCKRGVAEPALPPVEQKFAGAGPFVSEGADF